jgi:hypothetical protein
LVGILVLPIFSLGQTIGQTQVGQAQAGQAQIPSLSQIDCSQYTNTQEKLMCTYFNTLLQLYTLLIQQLQAKIVNQPVQSIQPTEPNKSYITVLSPNGGETYFLGSTQNIRWISSGDISLVNIELVSVSNLGRELMETRSITFSPIFNKGYYSWTIPRCTTGQECSSNFQIPPGKYYIKVSDANGNIFDMSDAPFSVVDSTNQSQSSITVVSLNGREKLEIGKTYEIKWYQQTSGDFYMHLERKRVSPYEYECSSNFCHFTGWAPFEHIDSIIDGRYDAGFHTVKWTIPYYIEPGNDYAICVSINSGYGERYDCSDTPFSIVK